MLCVFRFTGAKKDNERLEGEINQLSHHITDQLKSKFIVFAPFAFTEHAKVLYSLVMYKYIFALVMNNMVTLSKKLPPIY